MSTISVREPIPTWETTWAPPPGSFRRSAAGVPKFVFSSTCAVLGDSGTAFVREDDPIRPMSPYGSTKAACERLIRTSLGCLHGRGTIFGRDFAVFQRLWAERAFRPIAGSGQDVRLSQVLLDVVQGGREHLTISGRITPPPMERACRITSTWMMSWRPMRSWETVWSRVNFADITSGREKAPASKKPWRPLDRLQPPHTGHLGDRRPGDADSVGRLSRLQAWDGPRGMQTLLPCSPAC